MMHSGLSLILVVICFMDFVFGESDDDGSCIIVDGITVVKLSGYSMGENRSIPEFYYDGMHYEYGNCYDVNLTRVDTDEVCGMATDCLVVLDSNEYDDTTSMLVMGTTYFYDGFDNESAVLISQGITTVQPTLRESSPSFTHITGSLPASDDDNIVYGSGRFGGVYGPVRLSGAVYMMTYGIRFNCIFVLDLTCNRSSNDGCQNETVVDRLPMLDIDGGHTTLKLSGIATAVNGNGTDWTSSNYSHYYNDTFNTMCFTLNLTHVESNTVIGEAMDCLYVKGEYTTATGDSSFYVLGTTSYYIYLYGKTYWFITQGLTTVQPTLYDYPDGYSHITGAMVDDDDDEDTEEGVSAAMFGGDGFDECDQGLTVLEANLGGAVDMSDMNASAMVFNCLFIVKMECDSSTTSTTPMTTDSYSDSHEDTTAPIQPIFALFIGFFVVASIFCLPSI